MNKKNAKNKKIERPKTLTALINSVLDVYTGVVNGDIHPNEASQANKSAGLVLHLELSRIKWNKAFEDGVVSKNPFMQG